MSVITREDKHKNIIEFRPLDKRYRYKVNGETKRGVTTLIGARFGKAPLMLWAKKLPLTALEWHLESEGKSKDYIYNFIDSLKKKIAELEIKDATTGTLMHSYCEDYINGKKVVPPTTEPLMTMFGKFTAWWDSKGYKVLATEQTCYSKELDVCGTFDVIVEDKNGKTLLLDFKTSKAFYPDQPIQIATYKKLIEDSSNLIIDSYGIIKIPKDPTEEISLRMYEPKPSYLKGFKACKFLDSFERDFLKRNNEYNKLKKGKKMYQQSKSNYDMPFCGLTLKLYETGKKAPSFEYSASAAKSKFMCSLTKQLFELHEVNNWCNLPQVQAYFKAGYNLKWASKVQQAKETKYGADSEQVVTCFMVKPYQGGQNVDGMKPIGQTVPQYTPQTMTQAQPSAPDHAQPIGMSDLNDDEIPF